MLIRISQHIHNYAKGWVTILSLLIFMFFILAVLPAESEKSRVYSGSADSPDTTFFYNTNALYQMAEDFGPEGRMAYIRARFSFDLLWPIVYTFFLLSTISWLAQKTLSTASPFQIINLSPFLALLFDLLENLSTSFVMFRYPLTTPLVDVLAPIFSSIKWIFVSLNFLLLLALFVMFLWKKFISRKK